MSSIGEDKVLAALQELHIPFQTEYSFPSLVGSSGRHLRFDFACFDDNKNLICLIEFQGKQHYFPVPVFGGERGLARQKRNDKAKRIFCLEHNIKLLVIPYYDMDKINSEYILNLIRG